MGPLRCLDTYDRARMFLAMVVLHYLGVPQFLRDLRVWLTIVEDTVITMANHRLWLTIVEATVITMAKGVIIREMDVPAWARTTVSQSAGRAPRQRGGKRPQ